MINVKIITQEKEGSGASTVYYGSNGTTKVVGAVNEALHAEDADDAKHADKADYADEAGYATEAGRAYRADYASVAESLLAKDVQIEEVSHVGGQQMLTAASMKCDFVVATDAGWRCFFLKKDSDGRAITNKWEIGDQAYVSTFNVESRDDGAVLGNHHLWRLVINTDNDEADDGVYVVEGIEYNAADYHYIELSEEDCQPGSDAPEAGDDIVQLGSRVSESRQNAIVIAGAGTDSPYIRQYTGIAGYEMPEPETQVKPGDNLFTGAVRMEAGTKLPDGTDIEGIDHGDTNLLKNSGFTGDYSSLGVTANLNMGSDTSVYSNPLKWWSVAGTASVEAEPGSVTGYKAAVSGTLSQDVETLEARQYMLSFKSKGGLLTVSIGGHSEDVVLSESLSYYCLSFAVSDTSSTALEFAGNFEICEPRLSKGYVKSTGWVKNENDPDRAMAEAHSGDYLREVIRNGNTTILGGLILSQMLKVGNYRNGEMPKETGGMSGLYVSDDSPFLWGGGDLHKAFYTIGKYLQNPGYQATDAEVEDMAKFVVTHGGRAILNDIILRGYIYAKGGVFNGTIHAIDGDFSGRIIAARGFSLGTRHYNGNGETIGNGVGCALIGYAGDDLYLPADPNDGQQIVIVNQGDLDKTLHASGTDTIYYEKDGTIFYNTFTLPAFTSVTFIYSNSSAWYMTSLCNFEF